MPGVPTQKGHLVGNALVAVPLLPAGSTVTSDFKAAAKTRLLAGAMRSENVKFFYSTNSFGADGAPHIMNWNLARFGQQRINEWQWTLNPGNKCKHAGFFPFCFNRGSGLSLAIPRQYPRTNTSNSLWDGDKQSGIIDTNPDAKLTISTQAGDCQGLAVASDGSVYPNVARFVMVTTVPWRRGVLVIDPVGAYVESTVWAGALTAAKAYNAGGNLTGGRTVSPCAVGWQLGIGGTAADPASYNAYGNRYLSVFTLGAADANGLKSIQFALNVATGLSLDNFAAPNRVSGICLFDNEPETGFFTHIDTRWGERYSNMLGKATYRQIVMRCFRSFQKDTNVGAADSVFVLNFELINEFVAIGISVGVGATVGANVLAGFNSVISDAIAGGVSPENIFCIQVTMPRSGVLVSGTAANEYDVCKATISAGCTSQIAHLDLDAQFGSSTSQSFVDRGFMVTDDGDGTHFSPLFFDEINKTIVRFFKYICDSP